MNPKRQTSARQGLLASPKEFDYQSEGERVRVKLLKSDFIARSEARRLLVNIKKFLDIVLDFRDVRSVGQGFADEVFRVFAHRHPDIVIRVENSSPPVMAMIKHVSREAPGECPAK